MPAWWSREKKGGTMRREAVDGKEAAIVVGEMCRRVEETVGCSPALDHWSYDHGQRCAHIETPPHLGELPLAPEVSPTLELHVPMLIKSSISTARDQLHPLPYSLISPHPPPPKLQKPCPAAPPNASASSSAPAPSPPPQPPNASAPKPTPKNGKPAPTTSTNPTPKPCPSPPNAPTSSSPTG